MNEWSGVGEAYAASYASLCAGTNDALVEALGLGQGRAALDVGSGTGALAARLDDADWHVTGCDPEPTMRDAASRQHPGISFVSARLPALGFPDSSFDAVTANFVLNHVDDPRRSAEEMVRVAAPGAALAATIWTASPSWFWASICDRAGLAPAAGGRLPAERDFERTAEGFERMLSDSGWRTVAVEELTWTWHATAQQLRASLEGGVASIGAFFLALNGAEQRRFQIAFDERVAEHSRGQVLALEHTAALAFGTRV